MKNQPVLKGILKESPTSHILSEHNVAAGSSSTKKKPIVRFKEDICTYSPKKKHHPQRKWTDQEETLLS